MQNRYICTDMIEDFRLRVFLEVVRTGSFTVAASGLGISQSAVSQNVTTLEKMLGVQLLVRARGEAYPTAEGLSFKEYAEKILYWYDAATRMFGPEGRLSVNRPVRIAADEVIASYLLPSVLVTLYSSHPELSFEIEPVGDAPSASVFDPQAEPNPDVPGSYFGTPGNADVEITASPSPETMDFEGESRLVGVMDATLVASPLNRSMAESRGGFSTIAGVHVSNRFAIWDRYLPFLTPDLLARVSVKSSSPEAIKSMVRGSTSLVGILPAIAVRNEVAAGTLVQLAVQLPRFAFDIHFNPLPEFSGRDVCCLLLETLKGGI